MRIRAFRGLVPDPNHVEEVAAVPYDVVNTEEARALAEGNPHNLLHVDRAEIDLPPGTDPYSDAVYAKAVENFRRLQEDGILVREGERCIYLYRQVMGGHAQIGIAATCHIDDYGNDLIRKHEKTRPDKEDDRTRLVGELGANTGPIFLTYRGSGRIDGDVEAFLSSHRPIYDFTAPDGVGHTVWRVSGAALDEILGGFEAVPLLYVADGHHRSASAYRVGAERRAANPGHTGDEDYNWFLCVLFPADQLQILAYNRVVSDLMGRSEGEFLEAVEAAGFSVGGPGTQKVPAVPGEVCMYLKGSWRTLSWAKAETAGPVASLDVSVLQDRLLGPVLGIDDPRTSKRIDFVGGVRGVGELEKRVDSGESAVAFSVYPVSVDELMAIADAGEIMAPKCTWFEPKLRSGLFIHTFD